MSTLDLSQAAELLKVHPKTLQKLARRGHVPSCKASPQEFERLCSELRAHLADMARFNVATGLRQANVEGLE